MSRSQLTSTVEQNTGGAVAPYVAGKNKIINGDFGVWQRGTTFTNPANLSFFADRFYLDVGGASGGTTTWSQEAFDYGSSPAADKLPISGYPSTYFARYNMSSVSTGQSYNNPFNYKIEDVRTFAGQTVTFSCWVKSDSSRSFAIQVFQNFGSGGSSNAYVGASSTLTATTSWQRFTFTIAIPSISGKTIGTGSSLWIILGGLAVNTVQTLDLWGFQAEAGSVATPFTTATGTLSGELMACQRYFQIYSGASGNYNYFGNVYNTTSIYQIKQFPVTMRVAPTATLPSTLTNLFIIAGVGNVTPTSITTDSSTINSHSFYGYGMTGLVIGQTASMTAQSVSLSAEL